ncbi:hypothetical protein PIB30_077036 [Stylosanthes scabra]|uniref:Uncharacterized protein n=1 Tax=Stylosanthes scabra TaxID=79078 RepID=A0ABU6QRP4_9FABA|nr:hypothetical protein [Stylosanthes scabra]
MSVDWLRIDSTSICLGPDERELVHSWKPTHPILVLTPTILPRTPSFDPAEPYDFPITNLHPNPPPSPTPTPQYSPLSYDSPIEMTSINSNPYPGPLGEVLAPFVQRTSSTSSEEDPSKASSATAASANN